MNLDFSFRDGAGRLILAGWHADPGAVELQIEDRDGTRWPVTVLPRFARADLGTEAALGVLAVAGGGGGAAPVALLTPDGRRTPLDLEAMAEGAAALIAACLDETFAALLRALALGQIGALPADVVARLLDRARATAAPMPAHQPHIAAAADRAIVAPGGLGFVAGWVLTTDAAEAPLLGLVSDGMTLSAMAIATGNLARGDLAGYRNRYALTGTDGFQAVFRLPADAATRPAQLLLLPRRTAHGFGLMTAPLDQASAGTVTGALATALRDLPPAAARALMAPLALRPGPAMAPLPESGRTDAGSVLLLIPDTEPPELRDILRWLLAQLPPPVLIVPLAQAIPGAAIAALQAALREAGTDASLAPACAPSDLPNLTLPEGTDLAAGSAAALFQLGLPPPPPSGRAIALVHDPLAALDPATGLTAADLAGLPMTLRLPSDLLAPALAALPRGLLSAEGSLAAAMAPLAAAGRLSITRAAAGTFWPGPHSGSAAARLDAVLRACPASCTGQAPS